MINKSVYQAAKSLPDFAGLSHCLVFDCIHLCREPQRWSGLSSIEDSPTTQGLTTLVVGLHIGYYSHVFKYITSGFIAGFASLGLEIVGFRALAPYFGYSIYASSAIIGVILLALSLGYLLGGSWGDRRKSSRWVFSLVLISGLYVGLSALFYKNVSQDFFSFGISLGASLSTLLIFAPPTVILGALSPYLIKLATDRGAGVGTSSGELYAASTIGSLLGTFLTALVLIPEIGIKGTLLIHSLFIILLAAAWLWKSGRWIFILAGVPFIASLVPQMNAVDVLAATESAYSSLAVVDYGDLIGLRTDERNGTIYSFVPQTGDWRYGRRLYDLFSLPPFLVSGKRVLLLGLGAGTIPMLHQKLNPALDITGVEIDPVIVDLGQKYFRMGESKNISRLVIEDARPFLARENSRYDLVEVDLFWGGAEIPFYLATKEFFELTREHLRPGGLLAMNVYDPSADGVLVRAVTNTIAATFPSVSVVPAGFGSYFVMAGEKPIESDRLGTLLDEESERGDLARYLRSRMRSVSFSKDEMLLTDDQSPLEALSHASQR